MGDNKAASLKSIAAELGISVSVVSRVLSGKARQYRISEKTEKRVQDEAVRLGFAPMLPVWFMPMSWIASTGNRLLLSLCDLCAQAGVSLRGRECNTHQHVSPIYVAKWSLTMRSESPYTSCFPTNHRTNWFGMLGWTGS